MSVRIPRQIMEELRTLIYQRLDEANYLAQGRVENGKFMERLAKDPEIGGRIAPYTGREKVKTYIKDALINRYAKERTRPPNDLAPIMKEVMGEDVARLDEGTERGISLFRGRSGTLGVVSCGRLLKWETALRKLLEYLGRNGDRLGVSRQQHVIMMLVLMSGGLAVTEPDRRMLESVLGNINVRVRVL